ncbi:hypothetical protein CEP51_009765 [Fusarium floridanum]|uniref:Uncharacterized protein n=1 Tax=Fusarium floridanum TaxID=1325733 RepID=A0A428RGJ6_9HYPO|nr:hypothetical protein CEP51_009765 [Fusarium floridanum]
MFRSFRASRRLSDPSHGLQDIPCQDSALQPQGPRDGNSTNDEQSNTTLTCWHDTVDDPLIASTQEPGFTGYDGPASATTSINSSLAERKMLSPKYGPAAVTLLLLAIYSTALSGLWLVVAIIQPRWGFMITSRGRLSPSNAATLTALLSKTIEIVSVTVFISCIGQALTRRAIAEKSSGITLADMTIRNWVIQPGFIFTHYQTLLVAGRTVFGALALLALVASILYTTASEALVSPKLKYGEWEARELTAPVHSYYGNYVAAGIRCMGLPYLIQDTTDTTEQQLQMDVALFCLGRELSYQSTRDLRAYGWGLHIFSPMWNTTGAGSMLYDGGYTLLYDEIMMEGTRVDTEFSDVAVLYQRWGRIVDNVTVSIPHPSVWSASEFSENKILHPSSLSNTGGFSIKAAVVSPTLNTMCVNMEEDELIPLIYTNFSHSRKNGFEAWDQEEITEWHNSTVVDDLFRWGSKYRRRRPVFEHLPKPGTIVYHRPNSLFDGINDAGYLIFRNIEPDGNYTLCQMRSWLSTDCSTHLRVSGVGLRGMTAHCGDDYDNAYRYDSSVYEASDGIEIPQLWPSMLDIWGTAVASEQPLTDQFSLFPFFISSTLPTPELPSNSPTTSEYLSLLLLSTLTLAAEDTQLRHTWSHGLGKDFDIFNETTFAHNFNTVETFRALVQSQEYTSGHTENWQGVFYLVLGLAFVLNLMCLGYLIHCFGLISDITEPQNHFCLAMSSPPSSRVDGSYPDQLDKQHLKVSWRVTQSSSGGGYQFDDCNKDL